MNSLKEQINELIKVGNSRVLKMLRKILSKKARMSSTSIVLALAILTSSGGVVASKKGLKKESSGKTITLQSEVYEGVNITSDSVSLEMDKIELPLDIRLEIMLEDRNLSYQEALSLAMKNELAPDLKLILEQVIEQKLAKVLKKYQLSYQEFYDIVQIVLRETGGHNYQEAYNNINSIYNRTLSQKWNRYVESFFGPNSGKSLYYQVISPGQYDGVGDSYKTKFRNVTSFIGYYAIIDFLASEEVVHNYMSFVSKECSKGVQLVNNGNRYHDELTENDLVKLERK